MTDNKKQLIPAKLVNSTYNKEQAYKNTEEERNLYESMRTPANTHLIDEIINKILVIDKYRQVMETFGLNWFDAEKEVDKYKVITKTQQEEIDLLKSYVGLDKQEEQSRKIRELKKKQEQELRIIANSDKTLEEKIEYMSQKMYERSKINKLTQ
jgi:formyltetrahydrofolate synthetase